ncbi:energy-coupling factor transporter transmembrane component T [Actinocorallia sp. A-T 12471]|uniref:energy-coupling factor transporter transmembrane component T family protein n=1 Tax=Actinocorallia sp. A-T 12471 TaxID=3089813 RepID=UPI0029D31FF7|nr:energy-coupling factor transporter transmembrane component T [Actinocorallia sp. A-T 12471]MDX6740867.1 energy-coupling factor transporter transmembrane component T [Actinocorallia sp. A-T 12471]
MNGVWYEPGTSPIHRIPAGVKLGGLFVLAALVFVVRSPEGLGVICAAVAAGYAVAWVPARRWLPLVRSLVLLVAFVFAIQGWLLGPAAALVVCLRLVAAIAAAHLFTVTTRVDDLVAAVETGLGPLRRFGARPERLGLLVGLTLQAVAALTKIAEEVREAATARDARYSLTAFVAPLLIRTLRHSDELAEALAARGEPDDA